MVAYNFLEEPDWMDLYVLLQWKLHCQQNGKKNHPHWWCHAPLLSSCKMFVFLSWWTLGGWWWPVGCGWLLVAGGSKVGKVGGDGWGRRGLVLLFVAMCCCIWQIMIQMIDKQKTFPSPTYPKSISPTWVGFLHRVSGWGIRTINPDKYLLWEFPPWHK